MALQFRTVTGTLLLLAAAACTPPAQEATAITSAQVVDAPGADATVNGGVKIHYSKAGRGTPVVLLHGFAETSHMWRPLTGPLAKTHTVIAPDLRGAGGSDKPEGGYDKNTMAADIYALVHQLGFKNVRLVGHDIGLMVAYAYAAQHPDEVESLVMMDSFLPGVGDWRNAWLMRDTWHFRFYGDTPERLVSGRERIYLDHFWNDFAADREKSVSEADREFYVEAYAQPGAMRAGFEYFKAFDKDAAAFDAASKTKLPMPVLVLTGEKASGKFLIDQARMVATNVNGIVVQNSGHWLLEEAPQEVIPHLVTFLNQGRP